MVTAVLVAAEVTSHARLERRLTEVAQMRESIERVLARLDDRHSRTVRRANEAVLEPHHNARAAILAGTAEHYAKEMDNYAVQARAVIAAVHVSNADARLPADLERLQSQVAKVLEQAHALAPTLDALLAAVTADDADAILAASQELERGDRAVDTLLHTAEGTARRIAVWQNSEALAAPPAVPKAAWLLLLLWVPMSIYIAQRPLARVAKLALGDTPSRPISREEAGIGRRLTTLVAERDVLSRHLAERTRDAERSTTTTRRVEQELALLKLYNENLVNSLRAAIIVTDASLNVRSFNRAARLLLGLDEAALAASLESQPLFAAIARQSRDTRADLDHAINERRTLHYESLPYPAPSREVLLDLVVAPYMDESGAARGLLFVADDITDAVQTKTQLLAAERLAAVGRLSAQVAHEIRNPLSAIGLNAELLGEDFAADLAEPRRSEAGKLLSAIAAEVERLTEVTEGYLHLSRLPRPNLGPTDINQLISDLASMLREEMKAHAVVLRLELASPAPVASVDAGQLRQALLNVLRNSREAMLQGGNIRVVTRAAETTFTIEVHDDGPGIAPQVLPRVFEPFFSTKVAGTGLGLSLTLEIVHGHAGAIRIENGAQGGTVVSLTLPKQPAGLAYDLTPTASISTVDVAEI